jgi:hypothetical protein
LLPKSSIGENRIALHYSKEKFDKQKKQIEDANKAVAGEEANYVRNKRAQPKAGSDVLKVEKKTGRSQGKDMKKKKNTLFQS